MYLSTGKCWVKKSDKKSKYWMVLRWQETDQRFLGFLAGEGGDGEKGWGSSKEGLPRGIRKLLGVMDMFVILISVTVSQVYTHQTLSNCSLNMCSSLLLVNYTSLVHWFIIRGCFSIINQWTTKSPPQFNLKLFSITSLYLSCRLELIFLIPTNKKCLYLKVYSFPTNSLFLTPLTTFS